MQTSASVTFAVPAILRAKLSRALCFSSGATTPDPSELTNKLLASWGASNRSGYSNPRLDLILENGLKATDTDARRTLYHAAQQIISADRPVIPLYNAVLFGGFSASITGVRLMANGIMNVAGAWYRQ